MIPKRISLIITILLMLISYTVVSQTKQNTTITAENYILCGGGYTYSYGRDRGVSPLIYKGSGATFYTGTYSYNTEEVYKFDVFISYNKTKPNHAEVLNSSQQMFRVKTDYTYLYHLQKIDIIPIQVYVGGTWQTNTVTKFHEQYSNNSFNYDIASDIGATTMFRRKFTLFNHLIHADFQIAIPLFAGYVRPGYANSSTKAVLVNGSSLKGYINSIKFASLKKYRSLQTQLSLNYFLKNGNSFFLGYCWNYYTIQSHNPVYQAFHSIVFSTNFNLN